MGRILNLLDLNTSLKLANEDVNDYFSNLPAVTNSVKAFDLIPELRRMRALSPAAGKDFVRAVVGALSSAVLGRGFVAKSAIYVINWFLSSLANLVPIEVVQHFMGRTIVMQDVQFVEMVVRDSIEVDGAWSRI